MKRLLSNSKKVSLKEGMMFPSDVNLNLINGEQKTMEKLLKDRNQAILMYPFPEVINSAKDPLQNYMDFARNKENQKGTLYIGIS